MNRRDILKVGLAAIVPTSQGMPPVVAEPPVDAGVHQPLGILTPIKPHEVWGYYKPKLIGQWPPLTDELRKDAGL